MKTFLVTGTTSGLGIEIVKNLAGKKNNKVIMAVRDLDRGMKIAKDGYEETIAVNHLAAFMLTIGLIPHITGGRILFIGSGTHNPDHPLGPVFGFRGAQYTSIEDLLKGKSKTQRTRQMNLDRYATSKLLNTITAVELSKRFKTFYSYVLDPGLMPGTGLARYQNSTLRFLWNKVMPFIGFFLPDTASAEKSGKTAAWIMETSTVTDKSGEIFSYNQKPSKYVWEEVVLNEKIGKEVYEDSMNTIKKFLE